MAKAKQITALLFCFSLIFFFSACGKSVNPNGFPITDLFSMKSGVQELYVGALKEDVPTMATEASGQGDWEILNSTLRISYSSWVEEESPVVTQLHLLSENLSTSLWHTSGGLTLKSTRAEVEGALSEYLSEPTTGDIVDLFFLRDPLKPGNIYPATDEEIDTTVDSHEVYRLVIHFSDNAVTEIIMGTLASME